MSFAGVSGLTTNMSKSMVLRLHSRGLDLPLDTRGLTLLTTETSCRYLGVMVGQLDTTDENWTKCIRSLWGRLVLAREKTHTVEQRACLARSIAVPKITFLARRCWPTPGIVSRLHGLILDFVWGTRDGMRSRPWVPKEMAMLPVRLGA